ncbi:glutathione S-transferase C-terminal domain-containing protein homolog isoform X2 [Lycorma delicatula]|uniref:glutathione S-transferase C-terminal domain-containing protein homolog isoform X2 n=1 Tax=Lycorma delicatula TaxID=130591 RepID=UPI003F5130E4
MSLVFMMTEAEVFLLIHNINGDECIVPVQSAICLFVLKYLQLPVQLIISLVLNDNDNYHQPTVSVNLKGFSYRVLSLKDLKHPIKDCHLPVFTNNDGISCTAGLCAVLRRVIKCSGEEWKWLLGFRESCLAACAEVSLWTRYCEVDIINTVESVLSDSISNILNDSLKIPVDVVRFEEHLNQAVRVHNIKKVLQDKNQDTLNHSFAESHQMSLADIIIFPCFYIILKIISSSSLESLLPLVHKWYKLISEQQHILDTLTVFNLLPTIVINDLNIVYIKPYVPTQSLYKSDPKRYKPRSKLYTRQDEVDGILLTMDNILIPVEYSSLPFGYEKLLDWSCLPTSVQPDVPNSRLSRKVQQLENLAKAVLKIAQPGDTIVDFCSGSGHLGILVAFCLPDCHVILLDNKEESLARAQARVAELKLNNIHVIQCNLDYFSGDIQIGMSLHACGVASDLVIQTCLKKRASFIVCPCCYGSLQDNHKVSYPQSRCLKESSVTKRDFFVLGHCADQVHKQMYEKSEQGERCMAIVDFDRCLQAKEIGYKISVAKLIPPTCTPRNNLLVGIPQ